MPGRRIQNRVATLQTAGHPGAAPDARHEVREQLDLVAQRIELPTSE